MQAARPLLEAQSRTAAAWSRELISAERSDVAVCGGDLAPGCVMQRLVLVGGGHAHLEVLRQAAARRFAGAELLLISPYAHHHYSSMVPGFLQGTYAERDLAFDLPALCRAAGARFHEAHAERVDPAGRWVEVDGARLECDLVSADVGSAPAGIYDVPGVQEHAFTVRPMSRAVALERYLGEAAIASARLSTDRSGRTTTVCVVGGGAAGVEVSLAVWRRLIEDGCEAAVTLVDRSAELLPDHAPALRQTVARLFASRGICTRTGSAVTRVTADSVVLETGDAVPSALTIWLTGAIPTTLTADSALPKDKQGFWLVDETLRSIAGGSVWGGGDCIAIRGYPLVSKAGVYAVRQGPVLAANLRTAAESVPSRSSVRYARYVPQRQFLAILNTADDRALLNWRGYTTHARWAWWLKDAIDRRFMAKYRVQVTEGARPRGRDQAHPAA